ncbi:MAG: Eco57I restriction-modification methylase domain-containing protein [Tatlockia sp.]|nr:Eco57I restriction-modification methylase domain-containing protein [Tatlockia sp.]
MLQLLKRADKVRRNVAPSISQKHKAELGQYMTPFSIARFMASIFPESTIKKCKLLDAGAGVGALSCAFLDRWATGGFSFSNIEVCAYEVDSVLRAHLIQILSSYNDSLAVQTNIFMDDFIKHAAMLCKNGQRDFTHAILNPPYKKINSHSEHRLTLRTIGIETVNLYSAFVALAVELAAEGGQIVAIIPRSFCNGPYYRPFRDFLLERVAIRHMHLFDSRKKAFRDDNVLQENIILLLERGGQQGDVKVTTSTDDTFDDLVKHTFPFNRIVFSDNLEHFIHVPTSQKPNNIEGSTSINYTLEDLGIKISTGPVVDFRLRNHLRDMPESDTVPLLYPVHFSGKKVEWPKPGIKKPNAILRNAETEKWLYPNGFYCVVRRFSSKEEKRRIVACVAQPSTFGNAEMIGIENHLNVYHENKHGLPEAFAHGLAAYLNTTEVDRNFRLFSGHTQVNATDLKMLKYPCREKLIALGEWAMHCHELTQELIDGQLRILIA